MRLGRRHSCTITHWLKGITVNIWYCGSGKFATPTLPKALRNSGSWIYYLRWPSEVTGGHFFPPSLFRQKPLQPQVCYSLSTLCSFVWGLGWDGGGGGVTCRGGRHMLLLLYGYLSEERHVLSDWEAIPSCWVAAPWCGLSQSPRSNHGHINRMPPCTTLQVWKTNPCYSYFSTFPNESYVWQSQEISPRGFSSSIFWERNMDSKSTTGF